MLFRRKPARPSGSQNPVFTDRTRRALTRAREEAVELQHGYIGTEHILLGLVRDEGGVSAAVLSSLGVAPQRIRQCVLERVHRGTEPVKRGELPYTARAKQVLALAMDESRDLQHPHVGTEHLLLGLLREQRGTVAEVFRGLGVSYERAREETVRLLAAGAAPSARFRVRIDDASELPIYEQIVAQVREGVATRDLAPGERLPTVRSLADELEIAPGTVARAYAELERLGVVVTDGARGTRVAERKKETLEGEERPEVLVGLLRPVAVAAFHLGASAAELRAALDAAMRDIFK